jgi:phage-related protein
MTSNQKSRSVIFYKNYFQNFFSAQSPKIKAKIIWTLELIEQIEKVPETYLKHIESTKGLYEIRVQHGKNIYRIFCFFDNGNIIIVANGFQKKTNKTPKSEIAIALSIKTEYENNQS